MLGLALAACGETGGEPAAAPQASPAGEPPPLWFAVHPYDTPSRLLGRFTPLCDYLSERIGQPVRLYLARSYGDQIRSIAAGQVDLAYMGPSPYLRLKDHLLSGRHPTVEIVAGESVGGEPGYRGVLVTRTSSPVARLEDLRGRSLALASPRSFSGHFVPRMMLAERGIDFADLEDYEFLGSHDRVALAVVHGDFDAGGLRQDVAEHYLERGLRVIGTSVLLPPHVIVARPGLERRVTEAVRGALLDSGPAAARAFEALGPRSRFTPVGDADFALARRIVAAAETTPPRDPGVDP